MIFEKAELECGIGIHELCKLKEDWQEILGVEGRPRIEAQKSIEKLESPQ